MNNFLLLYVVLIILIIILLLDISFPYKYKEETFKLKPDFDENNFKKAKILYEIKQKTETLILYMKNNSIPNKQTADRLYNRFKGSELRETSLLETSAGYTINKGDEIRVCINKVNGEYKPEIVMFIILHELAHVMSVTYGHNEEFKNNMDFLVKLAVKLGLYSGRDFNKYPANYCGVSITNSPCNYGACMVK